MAPYIFSKLQFNNPNPKTNPKPNPNLKPKPNPNLNPKPDPNPKPNPNGMFEILDNFQDNHFRSVMLT